MARHKLMQEGPDAHPSRHFHTDSVKWERSAIFPVTHAYKVTELMGSATDFQRDEDGWISAEITWVESDYEDLDWDFGVYVDPLQYYYGRKQRLHITECQVNLVMVSPSPGFPKSFLGS